MSFNKKNWAYIDMWAKRIKAIESLGGKCEKCGNNDILCLEFHHFSNDKKFLISSIKTYRWSVIEKELKKCKLLCRNCHTEIHKKVESLAKRKLIEIKGSNKCSKCGCVAKKLLTLDFHHDKVEKNFTMADSYRCDKITLSMDKILKELSLCSVVCGNCHTKIHTDVNKFNEFKNLIYEKKNNYKEVQPKIDRAIIKKLHEDGLGIIAISKRLGCNKSTISLALKKIRLNNGAVA